MGKLGLSAQTSAYDSQEQYFSDAVLNVNGVQFQIHKVILSTSSPYFDALFTRWSSPDETSYEINDVSPDMMRLIVDFAYCHSVAVTKQNVQELFMAADMFNMTGIIKVCSYFLEEQLCPENCIGIWRFPFIYDPPELQSKALVCMLENFEEVISGEEFLQLSVQELTDVVNSDDLNVRNESFVLQAIFLWISHNPEDRIRHLPALLSKVRLALTSGDYISSVLNNGLVMSNNECLRMVADALQFKNCMIENIPPLTVCSNYIARPRLPSTLLLAFGGAGSMGFTNKIEAYDVRADRWLTVTDTLERPRAYHQTILLNGSIYCVGGCFDFQHLNNLYRFDMKTHRWHEAAPMHCMRCYLSVTELNGYLYAMGGNDGNQRLKSAERYYPRNNQWTKIADMQEKRSDASCAALDHKIYICGGFDGSDYLKSCEYYSPETNQWTSFASMARPRSGNSVIAYAGQIYVVGGFNGQSRLRSVEVYNNQTETWHSVASMLSSRKNFDIAVIDNKIYVVGGFSRNIVINKCECYDPSTDAWVQICDLGISRSALSCCVVRRLPDMAEYTFSRDFLPFLDTEMETEPSPVLNHHPPPQVTP